MKKQALAGIVMGCLLFLGAGSVVQATKTRNMELMGGLIRRMPITALCFLAGAVAISEFLLCAAAKLYDWLHIGGVPPKTLTSGNVRPDRPGARQDHQRCHQVGRWSGPCLR